MKRIIDKLYFNKSIWSIGIYESNDAINIYEPHHIKNPVLTYKDVTDTKAEFIADPFIIKYNDKWYMFFEILDEIKNKGILGLAISDDGYSWKYERIILEEDFHLSYPYVFEYNNKIYMMPETGESGYIKLYEADEFPYKWKEVKNLIKGAYWDASLLTYNDEWFIFAYTNRPHINTLAIFYSDDLLGEWKEHPCSKSITNNPNITRPAGRIINNNGRLIRYSQDRSEYYGKLVRAIEILELSKSKYSEKEIGIIAGDSQIKNSWNKDGMHTIDMNKISDNKWIVAVDGHYFKPVNKITQKIKNRFRK